MVRAGPAGGTHRGKVSSVWLQVTHYRSQDRERPESLLIFLLGLLKSTASCGLGQVLQQTLVACLISLIFPFLLSKKMPILFITQGNKRPPAQLRAPSSQSKCRPLPEGGGGGLLTCLCSLRQERGFVGGTLETFSWPLREMQAHLPLVSGKWQG